MDGDTIANLAYLALLVAALSGFLITEFRERMGRTLRALLAWGMIIIGLMAGFGLWQDIRRDILPEQFANQDGSIEIPRANDGHYYIRLNINGRSVNFMADTGASSLVLSRDDAKHIGLDPETLAYLGQAQTANGTVQTAMVVLDEIELGPFKDTGFMASVNSAPMEGSLLGMDYLGRFRIEIANDKMILRR
jgi:aspartyl protease family protein